MMSKIALLLTSLAFTGVVSLHAQAIHPKAVLPQTHPTVSRILREQSFRPVAGQPGSAQKPAQVKQRLTGYIYRGYIDGTYTLDSARLKYSGTRGSDSLMNRSWDDYYYVYQTMTQYGAPFAAADSIWHYAKSGSVPVVNPPVDKMFRYTYDAMSNILTSANGGNTEQYVNTYHPNGQVATSVYNTDELYQWFNTDGNVTKDSNSVTVLNHYYTGLLEDSSVAVYPAAFPHLGSTGTYNMKYYRNFSTYDAGSNLVKNFTVYYDSLGTVHDTTFTTTYTYDALNRLTQADVKVADNGTTSQTRNEYAYTGAFTKWIDNRSYTWNGAFYQLYYRHGFTMDAAGSQDTCLFYTVTGGVDNLYEKDPMEHNAAGYVTKVYSLPYDAVSGTYSGAPYDSSLYYYEDYEASAGIAGAPSKVTDRLVAYPSPARDVLHITTGAAWSICDAQGRLMASGNQPYALRVTDWPAGVYLLKSSEGVQRIVKE